MAPGSEEERRSLEAEPPEIGPIGIRVAGNDTTARAINEAIEDGRLTARGPIGFVCECGRLGCGCVVELSLDEYEDVRSDPRRFLVAPGHAAASGEVVAAVDGRYAIVAKRGEEAAIAQRTDPRAEGPAVQLIWIRGRRLSVMSLDVAAEPESLGVIRRWLVGFASEHGADRELRSRIAVAATEATSNAVRHAYDPGEDGRIHVSADVEDGDLEIVVADDGHGFRPGGPRGLGAGLQLLAQSADRFAIRERSPQGTELWVRFSLEGARA